MSNWLLPYILYLCITNTSDDTVLDNNGIPDMRQMIMQLENTPSEVIKENIMRYFKEN